MRTIQLFRKIDPAEWGGTESAMQRLFEGLRRQKVVATIYAPRLDHPAKDPFVEAGFRVERFKAFVPVLGMSRERKRQLIAVGGNLMSFDLFSSLLKEKDVDVIHAHALGRIGAIGRTVARKRGVPFLVTIHGGVLDLPAHVRQSFNSTTSGGFEWGKLFSLLFQSHRLLADADAVLTCNQREADLLRERYPAKRILCQPHGVPVEHYMPDRRAAAQAAWPKLAGRKVILNLGRIDPIKNQQWLIEQAPDIIQRHPDALVVLAGPCTDEPYGRHLAQKISAAGLDRHVLLTGGLASTDPRLVGLLQLSATLVLCSVSETFGLVLLEAWAAGTAVIASGTSGARAMIDHGKDGSLFSLEDPAGFHAAVDLMLTCPELRTEMISRGMQKACEHSVNAVAEKVRQLYAELVEEKQCAT